MCLFQGLFHYFFQNLKCLDLPKSPKDAFSFKERALQTLSSKEQTLIRRNGRILFFEFNSHLGIFLFPTSNEESYVRDNHKYESLLICLIRSQKYSRVCHVKGGNRGVQILRHSVLQTLAGETNPLHWTMNSWEHPYMFLTLEKVTVRLQFCVHYTWNTGAKSRLRTSPATESTSFKRGSPPQIRGSHRAFSALTCPRYLSVHSKSFPRFPALLQSHKESETFSQVF